MLIYKIAKVSIDFPCDCNFEKCKIYSSFLKYVSDIFLRYV